MKRNAVRRVGGCGVCTGDGVSRAPRYDAGDHIKFALPLSQTVTALAWALSAFRGGYEAAGEYETALDSLKVIE